MTHVIQEECSPFENIIFNYTEDSADKKSEVGMMILMDPCYPVWDPFRADVNFLYCCCDSMVRMLQIFNSFSIHNLPYITPQEEVSRGSVRISWGHRMRQSLPIHLTACHTYSIAYTEMQNMNDKQCHSAIDACVLHRTAQYIKI